MNRNNISFIMKYGSPAHVDKLIRSDIPHWDDLVYRSPQHQAVQATIEDVVQNPSLTDRQIEKILKFPGTGFNPALHATKLLLNNPGLKPEYVEMAAEHARHISDGRAAVFRHKNVTSKAMQHVIDGAEDDHDHRKEDYERKMVQLQKAGK